jgi:flagellar basal-body rod modification protein FlgD
MPEIGRPVNLVQRELRKVEIAQQRKDPSKLTNEQLIEKATGKSLLPGDGDITATGKGNNKIGKNEFLKMLTNQMQNQDPMNPMDQHKFAADLAQFSQLEQLTSMNSNFEKMRENSKMEKKFFAASFIGKGVVTDGNSIELKKDGEAKPIFFNLDQDSKNVIVKVVDLQNNITNQIKLENLSAGQNQTFWNGKALDDFPAPKGEYRISVKAWDENDQPIEVKTKSKGIVQSVFFDGEEPMLDLGNKKISLRDVTSFHIEDPIEKQQQIKKFESLKQ